MANVHEQFQAALQHQVAGQIALAEPLYRELLQAEPQNAVAPHAYYNLGLILCSQGRMPEAADCFRQTLARHPNHADAHNNLGIILMSQGRFKEAAASYQQALRINANHPGPWNNLGNTLMNLGQRNEAIECFKQALRINPNQAEVLNNLANAFIDQDQPEPAIACYRQALAIQPQSTDACYNLGMALYRQRQLAEANEFFRRTLLIDPNHKQSLWNRSLVRLLQGNFQEAWPDFEARWALPGLTPPSFQQPRWDGSPLHGKTILVYSETGLGDTIQFVRYARLVKERGGRVLLECPPVLARVLAGVEGVDLLAVHGQPLPPFDVQIPLLSLPGIFGTTLTSIPANVPYLSSDKTLMKSWHDALKPLGGFKIGIAWQGNPSQWEDRKRSVPLAQFALLAKIPGVRLLSLQVGPGREQIAQAPFAVHDLGSRFNPNSLEDLASVLMNLDLVVTVDTAVAHLAGALGVPVWVALSFASCWRWLLDRSDSPWYPTMRLFRQHQPGAWGEVFERIANEIGSFSPGSQNLAGSAPDNNPAEVYVIHGDTIKDQEQLSEAIECYRQALRIAPSHPAARQKLAAAVKEYEQLGATVVYYRQTRPGAFQPADVGTPANVEKHFENARKIMPPIADAHAYVAAALAGMGFLTEGARHNDEVLRNQPDNVKARWRRSILRLLQGDLAGGWRDYEARWGLPDWPAPAFQGPRWDGSPLDGKAVVAFHEQGFGDTIQFARYLPLLKQRGGTVYLACQPALEGLMIGILGIDGIVRAGTPAPPFDFQVPLASLPGIFQTTINNIPCKVPYLQADPEKVAFWRQELKPRAGFKVGVVWQGNAKVNGDQLRSIPLRFFEPLARISGISLVSLQKGPGSAQLPSFSMSSSILNLNDRLETFSDTAAVMMNLDLIVTSDTSIAHLAGALGVPVWTALQLVPDWRWFLGRSDSPWYPTMRLFRQKRFGDWGEVFGRIAAELSLGAGSSNRR